MNAERVVLGRSCGTCTLCCKVMRVPTLEKRAGVWCSHCAGGCSIYDSRPDECRAFLCGYLTDITMDDVWKPNRCNFVMVPRYDQNCVVVQVDPDHPDAWLQEPYYSALVRLARKGVGYGGKVFVHIGDNQIVLTPR